MKGIWIYGLPRALELRMGQFHSGRVNAWQCIDLHQKLRCLNWHNDIYLACLVHEISHIISLDIPLVHSTWHSCLVIA